MSKVSIVMGSDSDLPVMSKAAKMLEDFGIEYETRVISAHREPDVFVDYARSAEERGIEVIIAGAGGAAHLPGMCAAIFNLPVIGANPYKSTGWCRLTLFHSADAIRNSCSNCCNRRGGKRCNTRG